MALLMSLKAVIGGIQESLLMETIHSQRRLIIVTLLEIPTGVNKELASMLTSAGRMYTVRTLHQLLCDATYKRKT